VPVSKKRKKKRSAPAAPPPPRAEVVTRKKKLSKQQIAIYVFSALVILSLALSFIIGNRNTPAVSPDASTGQGVTAPTATPGADAEENEQGGAEAAPSETTPEPTTATE
jgi:hypothetical protein